MKWQWWKDDDPLDDIDPDLRQYLEKARPKPYGLTEQPKAAPQSQPHPQSHNPDRSWSSIFGLTNPTPPKAPQPTPSDQQSLSTPVPSESLYPDGRYAHLWSTYRPGVQVEEAGKSDQEKLLDILTGWKERQAQVGRAALENCADEQWAIHNCFRTGGWGARLNMCREENRALDRCVGMQSRFLRALGYAGMWERRPEEDERIQMHADRLYHRMLDQEAAIATAKEAGKEPPQFAPLIREARTPAEQQAADETEVRPRLGSVAFDDLPEPIREKLARERLAGKSGPELELAVKELNQEIAVNETLVKRLDEHYRRDRRERLQRLAEGRERFSDKIKRWFDFREYPDDDPGPEEKGK